MHPIERVFNRLNGTPVDRIPYAPLTSLYGARLISCPLEEYYASPEKYCDGQTAVVDLLEPDILFSPFGLVIEAEAFGSTTAYFEKNPPNLRVPAVETFSGIGSLTVPDIDSHPRLMYLRESTRLLSRRFKDRIPVAAICNSPTELPALIMGIENWIDTLLFHPEHARAMIELTSRHFVDFANALLADGATCIITPASFSNPMIITHRIAKEVLVPVLRECYARVKGPIVFHHGGARLIPFLGMLRDLPNVVGFVLDPRDSFSDARGIMGGGPAIMGNLNGTLLVKSTPATIAGRCRRILEDRRDDAKFIFTTSNADIPHDTPVENLTVIRDTVRNFGRG